MSVFRFKQFALEQREVAMKFGTDSAVLGAWATHPQPSRILDIGTGTGVLALMLAQRHPCPIDAVEIEPNAFQQAVRNFEASPWAANLTAFQQPIQTFAQQTGHQYDLIVCNPPYFQKAFLPPRPDRILARHTQNLPFRDLASSVAALLSENGRFYAIIPQPEAPDLVYAGSQQNLLVAEELQISSVEGKPPSRKVLRFERKNSIRKFRHLTVKSKDGEYTEAYAHLLKEYYLIF